VTGEEGAEPVTVVVVAWAAGLTVKLTAGADVDSPTTVVVVVLGLVRSPRVGLKNAVKLWAPTARVLVFMDALPPLTITGLPSAVAPS
jgi:hypothetical protein